MLGYSWGTAKGYFQSCLAIFYERLEALNDSASLLTYGKLNAENGPFNKIKWNMKGLMTARAVAGGTSLEASSALLGISHARLVISAYRRDGSAAAALSALHVNGQVVTAGRANELSSAAFGTTEIINVDDWDNVTRILTNVSKTNKEHFIPFFSAADAGIDIHKSFGDCFALGVFRSTNKQTDATRLFPGVTSTNASIVLSAAWTDVALGPRGLAKYKECVDSP